MKDDSEFHQDLVTGNQTVELSFGESLDIILRLSLLLRISEMHNINLKIIFIICMKTLRPFRGKVVKIEENDKNEK